MNKNRTKIQRRFPGRLTVRAEAEDEPQGRTIEGYAVVFDTDSVNYGYEDDMPTFERIAADAVTVEALDTSDILMTMHHDSRVILARSKRGEGSLKYELDGHGVRFSFEAPNTPDGDTALELVKRGIVDGCSFIAWIPQEEGAVTADYRQGENGQTERVYTIHRLVDFADFTLTPSPAYPDTECNVIRDIAHLAAPISSDKPDLSDLPEPQHREQTTNQIITRMEKKQTSLTEAVRNGIRTARHYEANLISRADAAAAAVTPSTTVEAVDAAGLVPEHFKGILDDIQKNTVYDIEGIKISHNNSGTFAWAAWNAGQAGIVGESEAIAPSQLDLSKIEARPERFAMRYDLTYEALMQTEGVVESIVRKALAEAMTRAINNLLLSTAKPAGAKNIEGPLVAASATGKVVALGAAPTFKAINKLKGKLLATGLDMRPVFVLHPSTACDLEATPKDAGSGIMCIENGKMCGCNVFTNPAVPEGVVALGDWAYQPAGFFGELRLTVDPYTLAERNMVRFILNVGFATATIRPDAFVVGKIG